jgi:Sec-independent protein translocase protein TatA
MIILLVTLVVVGPEKIPDVARMLGKGLREVRRAGNTFRDMFMIEENLDYDHTRRKKSPSTQPADDRPAVAGAVAQKGPARPSTRPVLLEPARRPTHTTDVPLPTCRTADGCIFETFEPCSPELSP